LASKLSGKTIAALAKPFDGGSGPTHDTIELMWEAADASAYLPDATNSKFRRVIGGLRALQNGQPSVGGRPGLPPDPGKLRLVASELATELLGRGLVEEGEIAMALDTEGPAPTPESQRAPRSMDPAPGQAPRRSTPSTDRASDPAAVMVVHGRDDAAARAMFDWLRAVGLRPQEWNQLVVSSEKGSPFIGEVLAAAFQRAQAVVVLFTPDERVQLRVEPKGRWRLQARPNVMFEAGMSFASHPDRTVMVVLGDQELPSDLAGRHFVRLRRAGDLQDLAQRLLRAGCKVDTSGRDWLEIGRFPDRQGLGAAPDA
jgi:predicted nucleotide-binding protein